MAGDTPETQKLAKPFLPVQILAIEFDRKAQIRFAHPGTLLRPQASSKIEDIP
jgi:hypothetical protein